MIKNALKSLADSSAWKQVRDEFILPQLQDIKDVTKELQTDLDVKPADMYLAKIIAAQAVEKLINDIDRFSDSHSSKDAQTYD